MTPGARLQGAIEVLDEIARQRLPADDLLRAWGKAHRFAGSKDRRAITERVYAVLRARARLAHHMGEDSARALVAASLIQLDALSADDAAALFSGEGYAPPALTPDELARLFAPPSGRPPAWVEAGLPPFLAECFQAQFGPDWMAEANGLIGARAPLDLRVNGLNGGVEGALTLLRTDGIQAMRTPLSALGLRLDPALAADVQRLRAFRTGWVEVQDEASQIAAALAGARPGWTVVDYCAGGGGKTLALGAAMRREGRLVVLDVSAKRLAAMAPRLKRAGVNAETRRIGPDGEGSEDLHSQADLVFVDAPCTGSGTWRRHPEAAWRLTPEAIARLAALQQAILDRASALVRPGGRLVYATCSVLAQENETVAAAFADAHTAFAPLPIARAVAPGGLAHGALTEAGRRRLVELAGDGHTVLMTPRRTGTDGFFVALFERATASGEP